jgi:hypothetical protein
MSFISSFENVHPLRTGLPNYKGIDTGERSWIECTEDIRTVMENQIYTVGRHYARNATQLGVQPH